MKKLVISSLFIFFIAGCSNSQMNNNAQKTTNDKILNMTNPASSYCVKIGGKSETVKGKDGEYGVCHLPNGKVIDEWVLYRENNK